MRERPPHRRRAWTQKVTIGGQTFYLTVGEYEDGRPAEIFIEAHKEGSFARGILSSLARMTSMSLQCGAEVADVVKSLRHINFPPNGCVIGSKTVSRASSVSDWIAQELESNYLKKPEEAPVAEPCDAAAETVSDTPVPPPVEDVLRIIAQDTANLHGETALLIRKPPSNMEYQSKIPYTVLLSQASEQELASEHERFNPVPHAATQAEPMSGHA